MYEACNALKRGHLLVISLYVIKERRKSFFIFIFFFILNAQFIQHSLDTLKWVNLWDNSVF